MTTTTRDMDVLRAKAFFAQHDADAVIARYAHELDAELRDDLVKLGNYLSYREQGVKPVWAKMSACRKAAPMNGSDRDFAAGERRKMDSMNPVIRSRMEYIAKRAGINTHGKSYVGALGYYDNPKAWVTGIDDVKRSAREQGYDLHGIVDVKADPLIGTRKDQGAVKGPVPKAKKRRRPAVA